MLSSKPSVLIARPIFPEVVQRLSAHFDVSANPGDEAWTHDQFIARLQGKQGVFTTGGERIDARLLAACPDLRICANMAVGYNNFDVPAMTAAGVLATNAPDVLTETTADGGFALLMAAARRITEGEHYLRAGRWQHWSYDMLVGQDVHGSTLGIFGMGRIGQAMAHKTHALGMKVVAYDPYVNPDALPDYITLCGLEDLLRQSDVVSVHCPLTDVTRNMLDESMLRLMKPSAYLVNTARGCIVDEVALDKLLTEKKLAGAAMDVLAVEPGPMTHPLFKHENFYCTPHMAWHSEESAQELKRKAAEETRRVLRGEAPWYQVNKF